MCSLCKFKNCVHIASPVQLVEALQDVDGLRLIAFEQDETQATYGVFGDG